MKAPLIDLNEWYREKALQDARLDHLAFMATLTSQELTLLYLAGQPNASYKTIAAKLGIAWVDVAPRVIALRKKLGLKRRELDRLARAVAKYGTPTAKELACEPERNS